ncbi:uncharacterized protein N0V89_008066 [Didymosphaeria variabile]|uniref:NTF2-like domain-containing protein n=1 Tax=Didymosphaeria variabile TaxID=1932322 RepID=A0A9W8XF22_9PLEO|nr:uncharacterized protein N0V89_008066 [Didymosphaeria variabile]KAJ4349451.1 hypothetical protein N0V89_008066 [Didymosphaeria variabile]
MRFTLCAIACLASGAVAKCLTEAAANRVANNFRSTITDYSTALAARVLSANFIDYSDGVNELINNGCPNGPKPLGNATFSSLADFQAGQASQPPIPFEILKIWYNCDTVIMRWRSVAPGFVQPEEPVTGIIVLETSCSKGKEPFLIDTVYSEFNSGAWLYDLGIFKPTNCTA